MQLCLLLEPRRLRVIVLILRLGRETKSFFFALEVFVVEVLIFLKEDADLGGGQEAGEHGRYLASSLASSCSNSRPICS